MLPAAPMPEVREQHVLVSAVERATKQVEDPVFQAFAEKWPILASKLLNVYGLCCYGWEQQPFIRNAEIILGNVINEGLPEDKRKQVAEWLTPGIFPTREVDLNYIETRRFRSFCDDSPFLQLVADSLPVNYADLSIERFRAEHRSTLDTLGQHATVNYAVIELGSLEYTD